MVVGLSALRAGLDLPREKISGTHFYLKVSQAQGHTVAETITGTEKNPMTSSEIEPATFRLVA
jgi:hypothetical protein